MNMKTKMKKSGVTLIEMVAVVAAVALLTMLSLPAIRSLRKSLVNEGAARGLINSTLASARAMAAEKDCYVGVRFQTAYKFNGDTTALDNESALFAHDVLNAEQYMIFIMHKREKSDDLLDGFWAVEGIKPIKLPDNFGVMDMRLSTNSGNTIIGVGDGPIDLDSDIDEGKELLDTATFSIIFSPSGKLIIQRVRCRNKDGKSGVDDNSTDIIINTKKYVEAIDVNGRYVKNRAMFLQDDYAPMLSNEFSRRRFIIFERDKFKPAYKNKSAYTDYLKNLWETKQTYVNPYTGQLMKNQ